MTTDPIVPSSYPKLLAEIMGLYQKPVVDAAFIGKMTGKVRYRRFLYRDYVRRFSDAIN